MIDEARTQQAVDFVLGDMNEAARDVFERSLGTNLELNLFVGDLEAIGAGLTMAGLAQTPVPGTLTTDYDSIFKGILGKIDSRQTSIPALRAVQTPSQASFESYDLDPGVVITDRQGHVQWVNDAFTLLCGYQLSEIIGKKPGSFLQGPLTDATAARLMSETTKTGSPCVEELVNYHKNGDPYWVSISITPVLDAKREITHFTAVERKIHGRAVPVLA